MVQQRLFGAAAPQSAAAAALARAARAAEAAPAKQTLSDVQMTSLAEEFNRTHNGVPMSTDPAVISTWEYPSKPAVVKDESSSSSSSSSSSAAALAAVTDAGFEVREYQRSISKMALFNNTLVCLPTGLGKTFIAAVVMFNFYRWFPTGKIVFLAPTRPLVVQQTKACFRIMGVPQEDACYMVNEPVKRRPQLWRDHRMFFLTPQRMMSDINRGVCPLDQIVCLVVDEAHKATGKFAYVGVVNELLQCGRVRGKEIAAASGDRVKPVTQHHNFRVLALSATPGSDIKAAAEVVDNLRIAHMEIRTETDPDVKKYMFTRVDEVIKVTIPQSVLDARDMLFTVMREPLAYLQRIGVVWDIDPSHTTPFSLMRQRDAARNNPKQLDRAQIGLMEANFALSGTLAHALAQLTGYGLHCFYRFMDEKFSNVTRGLKKRVADSHAFQNLMTFVRSQLSAGDSDDTPKLSVLEKVLVDHFNAHAFVNRDIGQTDDGAGGSGSAPPPVPRSTRVIIFTAYRESVGEIVTYLRRREPTIRATSFIGQAASGSDKRSQTVASAYGGGKGNGNGEVRPHASDQVRAGLSQKQQQKVLAQFGSGRFNVLVATSIAEEGLDIGEVDLIIAYDAIGSAIRNTQRMGRTGRKRRGRCVTLVSEGKEEETYARAQQKMMRVLAQLRSDRGRLLPFYKQNPRMYPSGMAPRLTAVSVNASTFESPATARVRIASTKALKRSKSSLSFDNEDDNPYLNEREMSEFNRYFALTDAERDNIRLVMADHPEAYSFTPTPALHIAHGRSSHLLMNLLRRIQDVQLDGLPATDRKSAAATAAATAALLDPNAAADACFGQGLHRLQRRKRRSATATSSSASATSANAAGIGAVMQVEDTFASAAKQAVSSEAAASHVAELSGGNKSVIYDAGVVVQESGGVISVDSAAPAIARDVSNVDERATSSVAVDVAFTDNAATSSATVVGASASASVGAAPHDAASGAYPRFLELNCSDSDDDDDDEDDEIAPSPVFASPTSALASLAPSPVRARSDVASRTAPVHSAILSIAALVASHASSVVQPPIVGGGGVKMIEDDMMLLTPPSLPAALRDAAAAPALVAQPPVVVVDVDAQFNCSLNESFFDKIDDVAAEHSATSISREAAPASDSLRKRKVATSGADAAAVASDATSVADVDTGATPPKRQRTDESVPSLSRVVSDSVPQEAPMPSSPPLVSSPSPESSSTSVSAVDAAVDVVPLSPPAEQPPPPSLASLLPSSLPHLCPVPVAHIQHPPGSFEVVMPASEANASAISSILRTTYRVKPFVYPALPSGNGSFVLGANAALVRVRLSHLSKPLRLAKLRQELTLMNVLYAHSYVIVQDDLHHSARYVEQVGPHRTLEKIQFSLAASRRVTLLTSPDDAHTAFLIYCLLYMENQRGDGVTVPDDLLARGEAPVRFLLTLPNVSFAAALRLLARFPTLRQLVDCDDVAAMARVRGVGRAKAAAIIAFLRRPFDPAGVTQFEL
jgi:Fanconi anemia group M protein